MSRAAATLDLDPIARPCPLCRAAAGAGRVVHGERFDPDRLDRFAFAARKAPELMHWRLVECSGCGLLFASPAPQPDALAAAYAGAAYDAEEESRYAARTYGRLLRRMIPWPAAAGPALDVGAGDGAFVGVLRELGFDGVLGVEPSRAAIDAGAPEVRPMIREGFFDPGDFELASFRLISSLHIVEHLADPVGVLRGAHSLLQDGGALFVVSHDQRAPVNRLMGLRSPIYDIEHLQLFSRRSLVALLDRAGFRDIRVRRFWNRYPLRYWLRMAPLGARGNARLIAAADRAGVGRLPLSLPAGNLAAVAWK